MSKMPEVWTPVEIAEVLKLSVSYVSKVITQRKDFPKPIQGVRKRWFADSVLQWMREGK
jgi:predicted DNA-binding transcriptional regulator AlpA